LQERIFIWVEKYTLKFSVYLPAQTGLNSTLKRRYGKWKEKE
jgi:hypothetical protein